jgi:hypothetical protein
MGYLLFQDPHRTNQADRIRAQLKELIGLPMRGSYIEQVRQILFSEGFREHDFVLEVDRDSIFIHPATIYMRDFLLELGT